MIAKGVHGSGESVAAAALPPSFKALASAFGLFSCAILVLGIQPIILSVAVETARLTDKSAGTAALAEFWCIAIAAGAGPYLLRNHLARKSALISLLLLATNLTVILVPTSMVFIIGRGFSGALEGLLMGGVSLIVTRSARPERLNGLLTGASAIPQVAGAYLLPAAIIPLFGLDAPFYVLAGASFVAIFCSLGLVAPADEREEAISRPFLWNWALPLLAAAIIFLNCGTGAIFSYLGLLMGERGFAPSIVGIAIASSLSFQVVGALLSAVLSDRMRARPVIIAGLSAQAVLCVILGTTAQTSVFIAAVCLQGLFWPSLFPFMLREMIRLDQTRSFAMLLPAAVLIGNGLGPFLASLGIARHGVASIPFSAFAMLVAALLFYILVAAIRQNHVKAVPGFP